MGRDGEVALGIVLVGINAVIPILYIKESEARESRTLQSLVGPTISEFGIGKPSQIPVHQSIGTKCRRKFAYFISSVGAKVRAPRGRFVAAHALGEAEGTAPGPLESGRVLGESPILGIACR